MEGLLQRRQWLATVLSCVALVGCEQAKPPQPPAKPPEVLASQPVRREVVDYEDFSGQTAPVKNIEIRARVTGYLDKVYFKEGSEVEEGAMLFEIDPRPYEAELARSEARLAQAEARLKNLNTEYRRVQGLLSRNAISESESERVATELAEAEAAVAAAKADRDLAKLNLQFTKVTAPIRGRISRQFIDPGNLVKADETTLTTIVSVDPVYTYFDVDERTLLRIRRLIHEGAIKSHQEAEVPVQMGLADEEGYPHRGTINFVDNKVDSSTGTLRIRGVFPNPERLLSSGLFVRVRLPIGPPRQAILVAEQALGTDQGKKFVYVVNDEDEVTYRPVKTGRLYDGLRVIEEGLVDGEKVIVSGLQRVRPGAKVELKLMEMPNRSAVAKTGGRAAGAASSN